jgi:uncharacterized Tic20 family protein
MAAISHFAIFLFGMGLAVPALIWTGQRHKSRFVSNQALQALAWQILQPIAMLLLSFMASVLMMLGMTLSLLIKGQSQREPVIIAAAIVCAGIVLAGFFLYLVPPLAGSIACLLGKDFQYPGLGGWIRTRTINTLFDPGSPGKNLPRREVNPDGEDNLVMAICHFSAFVPFFGLFVPLVIWITNQVAKNTLWRQATQATVFQGILAVVYYGITGVGSTLCLAVLAPILSGADRGMRSGPPGDAILFVGLAVLIFLALLLLVMLVLAIFQTLALVAGLRILRYQDYHYPGLDWLLSKFKVPLAAEEIIP